MESRQSFEDLILCAGLPRCFIGALAAMMSSTVSSQPLSAAARMTSGHASCGMRRNFFHLRTVSGLREIAFAKSVGESQSWKIFTIFAIPMLIQWIIYPSKGG